MTIKHLVLSGGGPSLFQTLGALEHLQREKYILPENIETIYSTSAGSLVGALFSLKYDDSNMINDYILKRPWKDLFHLKIHHILEAYTKKGIYDRSFFEKSMKPLLEAKDLSLNITLSDFYHYSQVEQHFFTFELNEFKLVDVSYKTHPEICLIDALQMSCAIPLLISPVCIENNCFIDGGVSCNYPLTQCIADHPDSNNEILGFKNVMEDTFEKTVVNQESSLVDFLLNFLFKMIFSLSINDKQPIIPLEVVCCTPFLNIGSMKKAVDSMEERKSLFQKGVEAAEEFLSRGTYGSPYDPLP
jgi:predicted acylesterase/phospholipase RssA